MSLTPFALERYFAKHEFSAKYLLSSSDCEPLGMSEVVAMADGATAALWTRLKLAYTESTGHPMLRQAIAESYERIEPHNVLVAVPEEAIFLLMHALLNPGDHVVCTVPAYQSLHEVARSIGCHLSLWQPHEELGWRFEVGDLISLLQPHTRLIVVNFPHNPTGYLPTIEEFRAIVDVAAHRGIHLFSDEMYRLLEIDENATLPAACDLYEGAVSLSGMSKAYGLPGTRIGWLASRDADVLERVVGLKDYTTICSAAPSELLAMIAVKNRARIIGAHRERIHRNLRILDSFFAARPRMFAWQRPSAGSICFPRMLQIDDTSAFCDTLVAETGIMLVPSEQFQFGRRHIRIGFGRENLPEVLDRFAAHMDARVGLDH
jgi:aspartate/methionine/tyrosine aminotransferase